MQTTAHARTEEQVMDGDPTQLLLTALGRFQRQVAKAESGASHRDWTDECMEQLISAIEIALNAGWEDIKRALTDTARVLQTFEDAGIADESVPFLQDSYEILCLMVGDLIVDNVRSGVMQKWEQRYARAVEDLRQLGLSPVEDDGAMSDTDDTIQAAPETQEATPEEMTAEEIMEDPIADSPFDEIVETPMDVEEDTHAAEEVDALEDNLPQFEAPAFSVKEDAPATEVFEDTPEADDAWEIADPVLEDVDVQEEAQEQEDLQEDATESEAGDSSILQFNARPEEEATPEVFEADAIEVPEVEDEPDAMLIDDTITVDASTTDDAVETMDTEAEVEVDDERTYEALTDSAPEAPSPEESTPSPEPLLFDFSGNEELTQEAAIADGVDAAEAAFETQEVEEESEPEATAEPVVEADAADEAPEAEVLVESTDDTDEVVQDVVEEMEVFNDAATSEALEQVDVAEDVPVSEIVDTTPPTEDAAASEIAEEIAAIAEVELPTETVPVPSEAPAAAVAAAPSSPEAENLLHTAQAAMARGDIADAKLIALRLAADMARMEAERAAEALAEAEARRDATRDAIADAETGVTEAALGLEQRKEERAARETDYLTREEANGELGAEAATIEKSISDLDDQIRALQAERDAEAEKLGAVQANQADGARETEKIVADIRTLEQAEEEAATMLEAARARVQGLQEEIEAREADIAAAQRARTRQDESVADIERTITYVMPSDPKSENE